MKKWAFFIMTRIKAGIEVALRHLRHVILMQELALIAFLAETSQPMLTHHGTVTADMSVRALRAIRTSSLLTVKFAYCRCRFCKLNIYSKINKLFLKYD